MLENLFKKPIDNFETIEKFMTFEPGHFYTFSCLIRNTDGDNPIYTENMSRSSKTILVKNYYIDNKDYYEKIKQQMINLCDITGARLYMGLDRKSTDKLLENLVKEYNGLIFSRLQGVQIGMRKISKVLNSKASIKDTSDRQYRTVMFDIDIKDESVLNEIEEYVYRKGQIPFRLTTKKGYHVFCYKKFNTDLWYELMTPKTIENVTVRDDQLGLVYLPKQ